MTMPPLLNTAIIHELSLTLNMYSLKTVSKYSVKSHYNP